MSECSAAAALAASSRRIRHRAPSRAADRSRIDVHADTSDRREPVATGYSSGSDAVERSAPVRDGVQHVLRRRARAPARWSEPVGDCCERRWTAQRPTRLPGARVSPYRLDDGDGGPAIGVPGLRRVELAALQTRLRRASDFPGGSTAQWAIAVVRSRASTGFTRWKRNPASSARLRVGRLAVAGHRDELRTLVAALPQHARHLVAVHAGQADVEHRRCRDATTRRAAPRRCRCAPR